MLEDSDVSFKILTAGEVVSSYCPFFIDHTKAHRKISDIIKLAIMKMKKLLISFQFLLQN